MLKQKGERTSDGWRYPSDRGVPLKTAKKTQQSNSVVNQTLNIYQMCENSQLDRSQPTPARVSKGKKMAIAFSAQSENLISSFHFPLLPSPASIQAGLQAVLGFQKGNNQLARQTEWVAGERRVLQEQGHLSARLISSVLRAHAWKVLLGKKKKKSQHRVLGGETGVIRGDCNHHCNSALPHLAVQNASN